MSDEKEVLRCPLRGMADCYSDVCAWYVESIGACAVKILALKKV